MQAENLLAHRGLRRAAMIAAMALAGLALPGGSARAAAAGAAASVSELLLVAIVSGVIMAAAGAAILFLRAAARAKLSETRAADAMKALRQELEVAQSIVMAEPQVLIAFEADGTPRLVNHVLDSKLGVPVKLRNLMRFASWLERGAALGLEGRLKELKASGRPFEQTLKTLAGPHIEAEGRASGSGYYLKFRDLAGRRVELANLLRAQRSANEELASQKALLDALPMPVWFRDAEGSLVWVNRAYVSAVEAARSDEVIEQQRELLEARQRRAAETALAGGETFRKRLQTVVAGERRSFDTIIVPVGRASAGAVIDVAPLENVQDKLSRQMAAHERTLDKVSTAVAIFAADHRLSFYNQNFREMWKLEPGWLEGKPQLGEFFDHLRQKRQLPEQSDYRKWRDAQLKTAEESEAVEDWWHLPDGRTVHVLGDRRPDGGVTYLIDDVTERLSLESRYNALIKVQRETLENLREGVALFGSDGRLKLFNAAFAAIWKLDPAFLETGPHIDEVRSQCQPLLDGPEPWTTAHRAVTGVFETRESFDGTLTRPDDITLAYAGVPLPDGSTVLTYIDISDTKRVEFALSQRNEALEAADKLKNTFLSHVSYELRTPLTNIIGFSDLMAEPPIGPLQGKQREYLEDIRTSSTKLLAIINDILDLTTIDAGGLELKLAPVSVRDIADGAELGVRERLTKSRITLETQISPDLDMVMADRQRLTQVLFHLLSNAIGFSPEGSVITLSCRTEDNMVAFAVQDSGVGIPEEYQASVFGRFESRSQGSKHRGAGLGLAIVKSLVELHGGRITLRSAPGVGTTVTALIPQGLSRRTLPGPNGQSGTDAPAGNNGAGHDHHPPSIFG
ncbi:MULTISPECIES: ATP-binding protein [Rhodomicrobium]|uniref:sensor histidine kinase n=1 Tax=Rhodomicrobium TaxID=1068 RepID=UPI000B4B1179|nr:MULTISPECIES: ATP-binding protein [Rhodomicrobium]